MRKSISLFATALVAVAFLSSCGGGSQEPAADTAAAVQEQTAPAADTAATAEANPYAAGEKIFKEKCQVCHQADGKGLPNAFPPLAGSDYLLGDKMRALRQVYKGSSGDIVVNGQKFNGVMPPQVTTPEDAQAVINYVLNAWGNNGGTVTLDEAKKAQEMK